MNTKEQPSDVASSSASCSSLSATDEDHQVSKASDVTDSDEEEEEDAEGVALLAMFKSHTLLTPQDEVSSNENNFVKVVGKKAIFEFAPIIKVLYMFAKPLEYMQILFPFSLKLFRILMVMTNLAKQVNCAVKDKHFYNKWTGSMYQYELQYFPQVTALVDDLSDFEFTEILKLAIFLENKVCENLLGKIFSQRIVGLYKSSKIRKLCNKTQIKYSEYPTLYDNVCIRYNSMVFSTSRPTKFRQIKTGDFSNSNMVWTSVYRRNWEVKEDDELYCRENCEVKKIRFLKKFPLPQAANGSAIRRKLVSYTSKKYDKIYQ